MNSKNPCLKRIAAIAFAMPLVLISACGGSSSSGSSSSSSSTNSAAFSVALKGPTHAIAGIPATYQVRAKGSLAVSQTVDFKDTSAIATLAKNTKVWPGPGKFDVLTNAQSANGNSATNTKSVFVAADPIGSNSNHSCALKDDGTVACWGTMSVSLLTDPLNPAGVIISSTTPQVVSGLTDIGAIATGNSDNCVVKLGGTVWCWGDGRHGELGNGIFGYTYAAVKQIPVQVPGISDAFYVAAGDGSTCAVHGSALNVSCWGGIQIEKGVNAGKSSPTLVPGLSDVKGLATGSSASCAIVGATNAVWCWKNFTSTPAPINLGITGVTQITAHGGFFAGINADKTVSYWSFEINTGALLQVPVTFSGSSNVLSVKVNQTSYNINICVLVEGGSVICGGRPDVQGGGSLGSTQTVPDVSDATAISVDDEYACALNKYGDVKCWGKGSLTAPNGQFGRTITQAGYQAPKTTSAGAVFWHNTIEPSDSPLIVTYDYSGFPGSCAIKDVGGLECWNFSGADLGNGGFDHSTFSTPGAESAVSVYQSYGGVCVINEDSSVSCGTPLGVSPVSGVTSAVHVSPGPAGGCAVLASGRVTCWGQNGYGIHGFPMDVDGNGQWSQLNHPARENPYLSDVEFIAADPYGTWGACARKRDKSVHCWGTNGQFQNVNSVLAQDGPYYSPTYYYYKPTPIASLQGATDITLSPYASMYVSFADRPVIYWSGGPQQPPTGASIYPKLFHNDIFGSVRGGNYYCGLKVGKVFCEGENTYGIMGTSANNMQGSPRVYAPMAQIPGLADVEAFASEGNVACVLKQGRLMCWGLKREGPGVTITYPSGGSDLWPGSANPTPESSPSGAIYWRP
jgi:Regulator of chromosome condensation (RCC1) repeat